MHNHKLILRIVLVAFLLYSLTAFGSGLKNLKHTRIRCEELQQEVLQLRNENDFLRADLDSEPDYEKVEMLARKKLGMLRPGDKIFIFSKDREELIWGWK